MPLKLLLDENLRDRRIWSAIVDHNRRGKDPLDILRVGDEGAIALGVGDKELIGWAAVQRRILVAADRTTLPDELSRFINGGGQRPGITFPRRSLAVSNHRMLKE